MSSPAAATSSSVESSSVALDRAFQRSDETTAARWVARLAYAGAALALIVFGDALGLGWIAGGSAAGYSLMALAAAAAVVVACWRFDPRAIVARRLLAKAMARKQTLEAALVERRDSQLAATQLAGKHEQARVALEAQRINVRDSLERELAWLASQERKVKETVAARRKEWQAASRRFATKWTAASKLVDSRYIELVSQHEQKIHACVNERLASQQGVTVARALTETKLTAEALPGLGPKLLERLLAAGVQCAADVEPDRIASVEGCGQKKAEMLLQWRSECEAQARRRTPLFLRPEELAEIRTALSGELQPIEAAYQRLRTALDSRRVEYAGERKAALERLASVEWTAGELRDQESAKLREAHAARFRETAREAVDLAARLKIAYLNAKEKAAASRTTVAEARRMYEEALRRTTGRVEATFFGWMIKTFGWRHASVVSPQRVLRSA